MKKNLTELVFIIDRSGSMFGLENDTIGGFNSFIEKQKSVEGECLVSTIFFNDCSEVIHDRVTLYKIKPLTKKDYTAFGCTALLDAVGNAINHIKSVHKYIREEDIPEKTLFIITTDGLENASQKFNIKKIKNMIQEQKTKHNWEFLFIGANIDAISVADSIGINSDRAVDYMADSEGTDVLYETLSATVCDMRINSNIDENWSNKIKKNYNNRKNKL